MATNVTQSRRGMIIYVKFLEVISASLSADQRVLARGYQLLK